jgi:hypothetical protein
VTTDGPTMESRIKRAAKVYVEQYGISVLELRPNDKRPAAEWNGCREVLPSLADIQQWDDKANLGIATGKLSQLAVIDCESRKDAEWFWMQRGQTPTVVRTRRGYHLYFRWVEGVGNAAKVKDEQGTPRYDVRGEGGYVVAPPSQIDGFEYEYCFAFRIVTQDQLPEFDPAWMPKIAGTQFNGATTRLVTNGVGYISKIRAVSGQNGHADTWRAANILRESGMHETEALAALVEWNQTNAEPPWSTAELLHKVRDAYR